LYDRRGRLWLGRWDMVAIYERGTLRIFNTARGEAPPDQISDLYEDRAGEIWVMGGFGLARFDGTRFRMIPERQGTPRGVAGIAEDSGGAWWPAVRTGLVRLPPGEVERALADTTHMLEIRRFAESEGVAGAVTSIMTGADGRIWAATDRGVSITDPRRLP